MIIVSENTLLLFSLSNHVQDPFRNIKQNRWGKMTCDQIAWPWQHPAPLHGGVGRRHQAGGDLSSGRGERQGGNGHVSNGSVGANLQSDLKNSVMI